MMPTTERFTFAELDPERGNPAFDRLSVVLRGAGYTDVQFVGRPGYEAEVTVGERINHATLLSVLRREPKQLVVTPAHLAVAADGGTTGEFVVSGGPEGAVVSASWAGILCIDAGAKPITGGTVTFVLGPCPPGFRSKRIPVQFDCDGALSASATVQFD